MSPLVWVLLGIVVVVLVAAIWLYNRLVRLRARADDGWATIDVQLRRRYDLIPNLVETVQGYATHERELFERVTEARTKAIEAGGVREQASAEHEVSTGLGRLMAVVEAYPELKADRHFLALQEELVGTESRIAYARQFYNDQVRLLNTAIGTFPSKLLARAFGFEERPFFDIDDPVGEPVAVDLSPDDS